MRGSDFLVLSNYSRILQKVTLKLQHRCSLLIGDAYLCLFSTIEPWVRKGLGYGLGFGLVTWQGLGMNWYWDLERIVYKIRCHPGTGREVGMNLGVVLEVGWDCIENYARSWDWIGICYELRYGIGTW